MKIRFNVPSSIFRIVKQENSRLNVWFSMWLHINCQITNLFWQYRFKCSWKMLTNNRTVLNNNELSLDRESGETIFFSCRLNKTFSSKYPEGRWDRHSGKRTECYSVWNFVITKKLMILVQMERIISHPRNSDRLFLIYKW